ncbi:PAS domain S-box protein [Tumidithrix elongata RA019]|uniref:histidine kinase n=1 Tax=Tumidithrix elongata BACA0141 TaxID=2716417 RepID=A0AAW9PVQ4_9CYAN|nr:PAS domain S-box protein [Tumidithrix elongata RA019]
MKQPEIPQNESERQAALDRYKILDTLPEQEYDDLTQLAARICGTPIALISLVDRDRQWFKSRVGIDAPETPRDISFCGHVVAENMKLIVPDATLDDRFADNPLVASDPNIRFYVGVPLTTPDSYTLGTLCAIDRQPKTLTTTQIEQLESLSRLVMSQLELRRSQDASQLFVSIVESSDDAIMTKTLDGTITSWNSAAEKIFGYTAREAIGQPMAMLIPPDRKEEEPQILAKIARGERIEHFETERVRKDGKRINISATISPVRDFEGKIILASKIARDITDRKASEDRLTSTLMLQQAILDSANFAIISTDLQGTIQSFNVAAENMLGYAAAEVVGKTSPAILHDLDEVVSQAKQLSQELHQEIEPGFEVFIAKAKLGQAAEQEWTYIRKDGSRFPVMLTITAIRTNQGEITGFLGIAKDITAQKQAEKQAFDITTALDRTAIVAITDVQGMINFVNDKFCEISKYSRDELLGQNHRILNSGHHPRQFFADMWKAIAKGETWQAEIKNRAKDGSFYWVDTTIVPFLNELGKPYQYLAIRKDITPRKAAELELQKLSLIASQTDNVAIVTNPQGTIEWVNESFQRVTGYTLAEAIGIKPGELLQGAKTDKETVAEIRYALARRQPFTGEILNYRKDGHPYWIELQINPVFDGEGKLTNFIAIEKEITNRKEIETNLKREVEERKRAVQELRVLAERLEVSNRELQDFAYVSSHDLQEPLRKIQAFGDRLKSSCKDSLDVKGLDYLERMLNAAGRAQILINDLLAFSRVTTKSKPFESVDLAEVLEGVLSDLEVRIEQTGATVEIDRLPVIDADPMQMRQILQNLIGNALKFQQEGVKPLIQVRSQIFQRYGQDWCEIRAIDNGIGFEQKYVDRIFQIFQRLHGRKTFEGTGIGLAICRKIAERHNGTLTAESEPDRGATFIFTLPIHQPKGELQ